MNIPVIYLFEKAIIFFEVRNCRVEEVLVRFLLLRVELVIVVCVKKPHDCVGRLQWLIFLNEY